MKKFTFGRKKADDDDANRQALFGKKGSPAPSSDSPYMQSQPANDPYVNDNNKYAHMTPYQQARARLPEPQANGLPSRPSPQNGYAAPSHTNTGDSGYSSASTAGPNYANGFANDKYGAPSGYGASKYSNSNGYGARPGGYGGLGRTDSNDTDANRDVLFSGARERYDQQQTSQQDGTYGASGADTNGSKYGGYGEQRELTAEEQEENEIDDIKRQIKQEKLATAQTAENAARIAEETVDVAMQTIARLGVQGERINHTEKLIDKGSISSREAEQGSKKLKSLNRSMFAVHVQNPFTKGRRAAEMEQQALDEHRADRELRESTRKDGYISNQRLEDAFRQIEAGAKHNVYEKPSAAEKSKYAFEDDDDDENQESERRIDEGINRLAMGVSKLQSAAYAEREIIESQNEVIDRVGKKSDKLSDSTAVTTRRLQTIR
ncbi:hypothetical protein F4811DRAFT_530574 [Daldinia bambusicola]|nr:hypothetical protein F4811DRAFT_530574 [Daldinia bambusicola]